MGFYNRLFLAIFVLLIAATNKDMVVKAIKWCQVPSQHIALCSDFCSDVCRFYEGAVSGDCSGFQCYCTIAC
ncbi:hypothetical protein K7X08_007552 [Anisodus acutangulus]|uniref:Uncharacterized protein n=1 Tax=Anisodus acutangulus TaxID=402998 RepID=A0A9Q1R021_9SOLA|nr:hypothetical protein K7X08_007552 [Anisodus acutangulus]